MDILDGYKTYLSGYGFIVLGVAAGMFGVIPPAAAGAAVLHGIGLIGGRHAQEKLAALIPPSLNPTESGPASYP